MKRTLDWSTLVGIGSVATLLVVNAALSFHNSSQLDEDVRSVVHAQEMLESTQEMLELTHDLKLTLIDAEASQRNFLIMGTDDQLVPYRSALVRWEKYMAELKSKTEANTQHQDRIKQLESMSAEEFKLLKAGIDLRKKKNPSFTTLSKAASAAKEQMDAIRSVVQEMRAQEQKMRAEVQQMLASRQERMANELRFTVVTQVLTTTVGLFVIGAFAWALQRSLRIREKAAAANREQRDWLSTTLTSIGDGVISTDTQGRVTLLNFVAQSLTGWSTDEARGKPLSAVFNIVNEQTGLPAESPVQRVLQTGAIVALANHTLLIAKDGTHRAIDDSAAPIKNEQGKITGVVLVFRDVSERRFADEAIRKGEVRLRMALVTAQMAIWEWKPPLKRIAMSESSVNVFGLAAGVSIEDIDQLFGLIHPDDVKEHKAIVQKAVENCEGYVSQFRINRPDNGATVWFEERGHATAGPSAATERVVALVMDITERKRTEETLKDADRRKNEFLAMLAHELRNPLAPIRNAVHIMRMTEHTDKSLVPVRDMMERQVGHLVRLVDDLLDVSRITRGSLELRRARVEVSQVIESALETIRPLIAAANHELTIQLPQEPLWINGDLTRLAQVVSNLLSNSVKYTAEGGHIWLTVQCDGQVVVISVRDNGIGIPAEMISHVFEMFTQVDRHIERAQGGLGIGLTLVRRLVEMHGGTVEACSAGLNKGSEFIVRLPLAASRSADVSATAAESGAGQMNDSPSRKILVVDDNIDSAESLKMLLQMMGNEVCVAHDGPHAIEEAEKFKPEVVLLDIGLPGMSGYEVARRLKSLPELEEVMLVAQTGWGQDEDRRRSAEAGFHAHLVKPVDQVALKNLLMKWK